MLVLLYQVQFYVYLVLTQRWTISRGHLEHCLDFKNKLKYNDSRNPLSGHDVFQEFMQQIIMTIICVFSLRIASFCFRWLNDDAFVSFSSY